MNIKKIKPNKANPRTIKDAKFHKLCESIKEFPKMMELRPIVIDNDGTILGGNMRYKAICELGYKDIPDGWVVKADELTDEEKQRFIIEDNVGFGEWDFEALANEWDETQLEDWGMDLPKNIDYELPTNLESEDEELERKRKEFEQRMQNGEDLQDNDEYNEFLAKFEAKKTTDDCYTPTIIYEALEEWVEKKYGLNKKNFVRPFYPNGDYQKEKYEKDSVVVDNPPFSITSEILDWYNSKGIKYFLFTPHLTIIGSCYGRCTALITGVAVIYQNGANVSTSFCTNLEDNDIVVKSEPSLYKVIKEANDENLKQIKKQLPKYSYDKHVIMSPTIQNYSRYGIEFEVKKKECIKIGKLDCQKESGKGIFGSGLLVNDHVYAEREKAEREKAEREKVEREKVEREKVEREKVDIWELSDREREIINKLNKNSNG